MVARMGMLVMMGHRRGQARRYGLVGRLVRCLAGMASLLCLLLLVGIDAWGQVLSRRWRGVGPMWLLMW